MCNLNSSVTEDCKDFLSIFPSLDFLFFKKVSHFEQIVKQLLSRAYNVSINSPQIKAVCIAFL